MKDNFCLKEILESNKIKALKISPEMAAELFDAIDGSREHLREYLFWVDGIKTIEDEGKAINHFLDTWREKDSFVYALFEKENNSLVGTIDVHGISYENHYICLGYWLKHDQTGKGFISDILPVLEAELFQSGVHRIVIECETANKPSEGVAIRNGYSFEGIAKERLLGYGTYRDTKVYAKIAN